MATFKWLDYFTEGVGDVHISVGAKVYTRRRNPAYLPQEAFVLANGGSVLANMHEEAAAQSATFPEFVEELTKIITNEDQREKVRSYLTTPLGTGDATVVEAVSEEEVTVGEFFHEMSKILTTKSHWEQFFSNHGINLALPGAEGQGSDRFRLHAVNGAYGKPSMDIRRIPGQINILPA